MDNWAAKGLLSPVAVLPASCCAASDISSASVAVKAGHAERGGKKKEWKKFPAAVAGTECDYSGVILGRE